MTNQRKQLYIILCDCGEKHTKLSLDDTEYFDGEVVVKDIQILIQKAEKRGELRGRIDELKTVRLKVRVAEYVASRILQLRSELSEMEGGCNG